MTRRDALGALMTASAGFMGYRARAASRTPPEVNLTVSTDGDLLAFKPLELTCPTGAHVHLTFFHSGKYIRQDHDWVLTMPGAVDAVAQSDRKSVV